jgi:hypothetical protein
MWKKLNVTMLFHRRARSGGAYRPKLGFCRVRCGSYWCYCPPIRTCGTASRVWCPRRWVVQISEPAGCTQSYREVVQISEPAGCTQSYREVVQISEPAGCTESCSYREVVQISEPAGCTQSCSYREVVQISEPVGCTQSCSYKEVEVMCSS